MEWDTDYDTSLRRCWPDPAHLAGVLMAVPSLSDSLAAAQATSPARKRKLFGGTSSPGRAPSKPSPTNHNSAQSGRQLANLPSSKRARLSHSHPLSRSSVSPPRQLSHNTASLPHLLRHHSSHHPSTTSSSFRRSPSPVQIRSTAVNGNNATYTSSNNASLSQEERTCVSCRRTATSLLQLAKFHKCSLCGGLSCPICSRTCHIEGSGGGGAEGEEEDFEDSNDERHQEKDHDGHSTARPASVRLQDDSDESVNVSDDHQYSQQQSCGKPVCRGCCIESPDGTVQCYRCNNAAPPR